jgi:hypothetical protein
MPRLHTVRDTTYEETDPKLLTEPVSDYYSVMPQVKACLLKRSSGGNYLLLHYNCSVTFSTASRCSCSPCRRRVVFHGSMQGAPVVPNPSILMSSTQSIVHPGIVYYAVMHSYSIPMVGLHVPIQEATSLV